MRIALAWIASLLLLIQCASVQTPLATFTSRPPGWTNLRIAVVGDLQRTSRYEVWRERNTIQPRLIKQIASNCPDALILLGDQVFEGSSTADWQYFDNAMKPISKIGIPVYPLYGNHEYFGVDAIARSNMRWRFPIASRTWYSVAMDSIGFVMLNTNFDEMSRDSAILQLRWFKTEIRTMTENPAIRSIIVCGHHPPFTNSSIVQDEMILRRYFLPVFERSYKGQLWLSGHSHAYEHFLHNGRHYVVSGGGGGPRHLVISEEGIRRHKDLYEGNPIRPFHYLLVRRNAGTLHVEMIPFDTDEDRVYEFVCPQRPERQSQ